MKNILLTFFCFLARLLIRLRYRIKIKGLNNLDTKNFDPNQGILFLPNHPAHLDPIFIGMYLWPKFKLRPIVIEYVYRQGGINTLMKLIDAISIPNFDTSLNEVKLKRAKEVLDIIVKGINKKENFLLYPSGRLKHTGKEILGGASATHSVLQECPKANVVLIRTSGLWGSSFSRAYTGSSPDFKSTLKKAMTNLLKSFIFFMPKRRVLMEIEIAPKDFPKEGSRLEINKYLEKWFNQYPCDGEVVDIEKPSIVSYSPFHEKVYKLYQTAQRKDTQTYNYETDVEKAVFEEIAKITKMSQDQINASMDLAQDLGMDSLDIAELITFLGVQFDIGAVFPEDILTVNDVLQIASGVKKPQKKELEEILVHHWPEETKRLDPIAPRGKTIQEAFIRSCKRMKSSSATGDDIVGTLDYKKLLIAAIVLSEKIKKYDSKNIAIMLPASIGSFLLIFATLLANKVPVMLNWTLGPRYLDHMMEITKSTTVISSWKFLEKLTNVEFGSLAKKIVHLEDIKKSVSKLDKIKALLKTFSPTRSILRSLGLNKVSEDAAACVLFTSGTEAAPKGVTLSHKNILENQKAIFTCGVDLKKSDIFYGILPPFHSFGFSIAGLLPILSGIKIAFFPDPTDSFSLASGIERWKITILCAAPSFLKALLQAATKDQLKSMRLFVTGAEKTPKDLFEKVKNVGEDKKLIEGYGITECAPCISINAKADPKYGVGKPLENVSICFIHPETEKLVTDNKEAEICIKGPNVFNGYISVKKDPFILINGEKWYKTGDLGYLDKDKNLIISGRLKRFTKIAGEMVSLGAVEEVISQKLIEQKHMSLDGPLLAVLAKEEEGSRPYLILFTTTDLTKSEANVYLKEAGFSNLVKITTVKKIDTIPLMGTGKTDYRFLQNMLD